jgi:Toprim-like
MQPNHLRDKILLLRAKCSLEWAWVYLNCPDKPGRSCLSPLRPEKKPSFSVYETADGQRWYDHGLGTGGDIIDLWAAVKGVSLADAIRELESLAHIAQPPRKSTTAYSPARELVYPDNFRRPTDDECLDLALLRGLGTQTWWLAGQLGTLLVGEDPEHGQLLWWLTDQSRRGLEGRTFTGEDCWASGKKCYAYPGTTKGWAYGLSTTNPSYDALQTILMVEGGPDYFGALELAIIADVNFQVVAMLGAAARFSSEALERLKGKTVLIVPHNDPPGQKAAEAWAAQLAGIASCCLIQDIPEGVKDLNDLVRTNDPHLLRIIQDIA